ncbi:MAG: DNA alkylation repair protein [Anaerolineae bacterium]
MAEVDRDLIRVQVVGLLEQVGEPQVFDEGLRDLLRSLGSEEQVAGAAQFIPGLGESYGAPLPALRIIAAELAKWGQRRPAQAFALVERLWHNGSRDERVIAAKMLERLGKREWAETLEIAASFVDDIRNWEECDQLACFGLRYVVQRHPEAVLPRCENWVRSEDRWTRRFGVAVLTSLPKDKTYQPSEQEFAILDAVMADEAREVQDAVAWALREIGKRHPAAVAGYLRRHAQDASRPTRRIVKQAMKKLPHEEQEALRILLETN